MKQYPQDHIKNIALLGHGNAGKTTLADAILYYGKATERIGLTQESTTVMDFDPEEKKRKVSLSTACYALEINGYKLNLLDAPGLFDFECGVSEDNGCEKGVSKSDRTAQSRCVFRGKNGFQPCAL